MITADATSAITDVYEQAKQDQTPRIEYRASGFERSLSMPFDCFVSDGTIGSADITVGNPDSTAVMAAVGAAAMPALAYAVVKEAGVGETPLERARRTRAGLLARKYAQRHPLSVEDDARFQIATERLEAYAPRVTTEDLEKLVLVEEKLKSYQFDLAKIDALLDE